MSPAVFRFIVIVSLVLPLGALGVEAMFPSLVPQGLAKAVEADPLPSALEHGWFIAVTVALVVAAVAGAGGMLLFKRWARTLSLWSTVLFLLLYPFVGATVESGVAVSMNEASSMLWGAALAVAYFGSLRRRFGDSVDA